MCEKARVFISCGQRRETEELEIAEKIANDLKGLGFDPYVALQEQKLEGVKENIFRKLSNSEYFLFIDFKREKLADSDVCRGSLFSHQELAIATFLGHEVLAFQEEGVKKDDGVLRFIQANCIPFAKRTDLPATVLAKIKEKGWEATWRNELFLKPKMTYVDALAEWGWSRFYHIEVENKHKEKIAHNCVAYVKKVKNLINGEIKFFEFVELKWRGVKTESVSIPPKSMRKLDAAYIKHAKPNIAVLGINRFLVDWGGYLEDYKIQGVGDYEIDYVVFSDNFAPAEATYKLHIAKNLQETKVERILNSHSK